MPYTVIFASGMVLVYKVYMHLAHITATYFYWFGSKETCAVLCYIKI